VLDHQQLQRQADLLRRQPDAVGVTHRLDHIVDQPLHADRAELIRRDAPSLLAQDRVTEEPDLENGHGLLRNARSSSPSVRQRPRQRKRPCSTPSSQGYTESGRSLAQKQLVAGRRRLTVLWA
jgi:hypothetical protein